MTKEDFGFDARLDLVPEDPGVYIMKDASGSVIYVGKALRLRSRLRSYFTPNPKGNPKVISMISHITDFDYIVCANETEALLLECNLIKSYRPKYNILLTDDKEYPYIKITLNEDFPRVLKAYRIEKDIDEGVRYYGPYLNGALNKSLDTLKTFYPVRNCSNNFPRDIGKRRPCLNYYIGKCAGVCAGLISKEDYMVNIEGIIGFLEGKYDDIIRQIQSSMEKASEEMKYEKAAQYRDRLSSLKALMEKQTVAMTGKKDSDVIGISIGEAESCILKLEIRQGRMIGTSVFFISGDNDYNNENIATALVQHYSQTPFIPSQILLGIDIGDYSVISESISKLKGRQVTVRHAQKGVWKDLSDMANRNARAALKRRTMFAGSFAFAAKETLDRLSKVIFGEEGRIIRIEAFDVSNYKDDDIAASMVVFEHGKALRSGYRLFKIKRQDFQDDLLAMREVLERRLARAGDTKFGSLPQLVLVDGGLNHVRVAAQTLAHADLNEEIYVLGMVKDSRHRTRGLVDIDGRELVLSQQRETLKQDFGRMGEVEEDFLEDEDRKNLLRLISGIQDEAHRFAGNYTRKLSKKRQIRFELEEIEGVGPARRKALMARFGSIRKIKLSTAEEISQTPGVSLEIAENIYKYFNEK